MIHFYNVDDIYYYIMPKHNQIYVPVYKSCTATFLYSINIPPKVNESRVKTTTAPQSKFVQCVYS